MTLRHLKSLQEDGMTCQGTSKYRSGFARCVSEANAYLQGKGIDLAPPNIGQRLISHLNNLLSQMTPPPGTCTGPSWVEENGRSRGVESHQAVSCVDSGGGFLTISRTTKDHTLSKTTLPLSCEFADKDNETQPVTAAPPREGTSPPWSPPSPPLTDTVQLRLSLHKMDGLMRQEPNLSEFVMSPVRVLIRGPNEIGVPPQQGPVPIGSGEHSFGEDKPLNLVTGHRGTPDESQLFQKHLEHASPQHAQGYFPGHFDAERTPHPLSPPSSASSTPEPPQIQVALRAASSSDPGTNPESLGTRRSPAVSSSIEQSKVHWRPW